MRHPDDGNLIALDRYQAKIDAEAHADELRDRITAGVVDDILLDGDEGLDLMLECIGQWDRVARDLLKRVVIEQPDDPISVAVREYIADVHSGRIDDEVEAALDDEQARREGRYW